MFVSIGLLHFLYPLSDVIVFCCFLSGVVRLIYTNKGIIVSAMEKFFVSDYFTDTDQILYGGGGFLQIQFQWVSVEHSP
jgi:hypothetical protein